MKLWFHTIRIPNQISRPVIDRFWWAALRYGLTMRFPVFALSTLDGGRPAKLEAPDYLSYLMAVVGSLHFVAPELMAKQIPSFIPFKEPLVYISGVVEVACAAGLHRRSPWAAKTAAVTLAAIWPANIQMAIDASSGRGRGLGANQAVMWGRVPLQLPLIWAALKARPQPAPAA
jgi:uncharacterized membrane protein